ncbi:MAG: hypothetical protein ACLP9Y_14395 [Mycobacterium sp.]
MLRFPDLRFNAGWATKPLGRLAEGEEVAEGLLLACSPAASYAVGMAMALEGGVTIGLAHPKG